LPPPISPLSDCREGATRKNGDPAAADPSVRPRIYLPQQAHAADVVFPGNEQVQVVEVEVEGSRIALPVAADIQREGGGRDRVTHIAGGRQAEIGKIGKDTGLAGDAESAVPVEMHVPEMVGDLQRVLQEFAAAADLQVGLAGELPVQPGNVDALDAALQVELLFLKVDADPALGMALFVIEIQAAQGDAFHVGSQPARHPGEPEAHERQPRCRQGALHLGLGQGLARAVGEVAADPAPQVQVQVQYLQDLSRLSRHVREMDGRLVAGDLQFRPGVQVGCGDGELPAADRRRDADFAPQGADRLPVGQEILDLEAALDRFAPLAPVDLEVERAAAFAQLPGKKIDLQIIGRVGRQVFHVFQVGADRDGRGLGQGIGLAADAEATAVELQLLAREGGLLDLLVAQEIEVSPDHEGLAEVLSRGGVQFRLAEDMLAVDLQRPVPHEAGHGGVAVDLQDMGHVGDGNVRSHDVDFAALASQAQGGPGQWSVEGGFQVQMAAAVVPTQLAREAGAGISLDAAGGRCEVGVDLDEPVHVPGDLGVGVGQAPDGQLSQQGKQDIPGVALGRGVDLK
jgi:hypothetical protein